MASHRRPIRLTTPSLLLALVLVMGSAAPAIARDTTIEPGGVLGAAEAPSAPRADTAGSRDVAPRTGWRLAELERADRPATQPRTAVRQATPDVPVATPVAVARATTTTTQPATTATSYHGRNHVWIPGLGVNRSVSFFACTSKAYPGDRVYRWGCAGSNNVYLFGHAQSVFKPLRDAYVSGRLRKGMALHYAGSDGVVHRYTVRWWKVTTPDKGAWAYASQATPSLTLQTCVGARGQYRLVVRLVQTD